MYFFAHLFPLMGSKGKNLQEYIESFPLHFFFKETLFNHVKITRNLWVIDNQYKISGKEILLILTG